MIKDDEVRVFLGFALMCVGIYRMSQALPYDLEIYGVGLLVVATISNLTESEERGSGT